MVWYNIIIIIIIAISWIIIIICFQVICKTWLNIIYGFFPVWIFLASVWIFSENSVSFSGLQVVHSKVCLLYFLGYVLHNLFYYIFGRCSCNFLSPRPSVRVLSAMSSRFWLVDWLIDWLSRTNHHACAGYWEGNVVSDDKNLSRSAIPLWNFFKQKRTVMTDMNEKTPESHECKRQLRLQK